MIENLAYMVNQGIFAGLVLFGFYIAFQSMRTFLFPQGVGEIVSIGVELNIPGRAEHPCKTCTLMPAESGRSTIPLNIRLDSGEVCNAEISPCSICIDRMKIGDRVGITKTGSRIIAQKISKCLCRGT